MIDDLFGPSIKRARLIADLDALHAALLAFSDFVADLPDAVDVVEINPLILGSGRWGGVTAIDAAVQGSAS
jgi:succinyl-CoA synthetase beta subunit